MWASFDSSVFSAFHFSDICFPVWPYAFAFCVLQGTPKGGIMSAGSSLEGYGLKEGQCVGEESVFELSFFAW